MYNAILDKYGEWVTDKKGLLPLHPPDLFFSYITETKFCQYVWTDEQYATLANMLKIEESVNPDEYGYIHALSDKIQPLAWILYHYKEHSAILSVIEHRRINATSFGIREAQGVFVLLYQLEPKLLPLFLNNENNHIRIIAEWRLKYTDPNKDNYAGAHIPY